MRIPSHIFRAKSNICASHSIPPTKVRALPSSVPRFHHCIIAQYVYMNLTMASLPRSTRIPKINSVVENVVACLDEPEQQKISKQMITRVEEQLRILRNRMGGPSGRVDRPEGRAAALLDLVVRGENHKAPLNGLSKACGMSPKDFNNLATKVGHHVYALKQVAPPQHKQVTYKQVTYKSQRGRKYQKPTVADPRAKPPAKKSIISKLSIRFVSLLPDSLGFAKRAQQLFEDMQHQIIRTAKKHERDRYLNDIQQNSETYQVACFYHLLVSEKSINDEASMKEVLWKEAKVRSAKEFDAFSIIVQKYADELEDAKSDKKRPAGGPADSHKKQRKTKRSIQAALEEEATEREARKQATKELLQLVEGGALPDGNVSVDEGIQHAPVEKYVYSESFKTWTTSVLESAIKRARNSVEDTDDELTEKRALQKAADAVLAKYAIVV